MSRITPVFLVLVFWFNYSGTQAQSIKTFTLTNTVNNKPVSLTDFSGKKGIVVIFTSNYCPYSKLYETRIEDLASRYSSKGIQFILINPNNPEASKDDSVEEMAKTARERGYQFPYLADKDQQVARIFGANKTPEAYVLKKSGAGFTIVYHGALDDNPQVASDVSKHYLENAIQAVLNGQTPASHYERPTGCMIKRG